MPMVAAYRCRYRLSSPISSRGPPHAWSSRDSRPDLCALARPHLSNPHFALHAAAELGYAEQAWPKQYLAGKAQFERTLRRDSDMAIII